MENLLIERRSYSSQKENQVNLLISPYSLMLYKKKSLNYQYTLRFFIGRSYAD